MQFKYFLIFLTLVALTKSDVFDIDDDVKMHTAHRLTLDQMKQYGPMPPSIKLEERTESYWKTYAQNSLKEKLGLRLNKNIAKNVILFIGDGMSISTLVAARITLGGEEKKLSFEKFPVTGLSKTYCVDSQVADSACSATSYLCGVKSNIFTTGVSANVQLFNCTAANQPENQLKSIAWWSHLKGKKTGLVTTTTVTHASPSGVYANVASRFWESDTEILKTKHDPKECVDIAQQLVQNDAGKILNVVMGGGRQYFIPKEEKDEQELKGHRSDKRNLIKEWISNKNSTKAKYIYDKDQLLKLPDDTEYVLGLFAPSHIDYNLERDDKLVPSLEEMTEAAIKLLSKGPKGFFLFVESGLIDTAHHETKAKKAIDETIELSKAVQKAVDMTNDTETLIIVSSDHSHTLSISGYPPRKNNILNYGGEAKDKLPYLTLNYANGPKVDRGHTNKVGSDNTEDNDYTFPGIFPVDAETHGGDDVAIFAKGPWEFLFTGVNEENMIPHLAAYASCVGDGLTACDN